MNDPPSDGPSPGSQSYHQPPRGVAGVAAVATVLGATALAFVRFRPSRVAIEGASMMPTLLPGDWALVVSPRRHRRGDVVVVEHPGRPGYEMVKRVTGVPGDTVADRLLGPDEWWVAGDHPASSTDSRHFGPVTREELKAKVLLVYWPPHRRHVVR